MIFYRVDYESCFLCFLGDQLVVCSGFDEFDYTSAIPPLTCAREADYCR